MKKSALFMLDTNIASYIIRGANSILRKHLNQISINALCISTITQGELIYGLELKPGATTLKKLIREFLLRPKILPWDENAAKQYGILRARLEKAGTPMGNMDAMIAAHALSEKAVLVTNDNAFSRIKGLIIEDWSKI
ncbi:MAG: type II toxin-antitoxin system VapC family toxin [Candidatus Omnitrophica bacterium]|nr:type II toxin-antitoxin system VapC family toxin [Candidatus Omnitrophota bacterium]